MCSVNDSQGRRQKEREAGRKPRRGRGGTLPASSAQLGSSSLQSFPSSSGPGPPLRELWGQRGLWSWVQGGSGGRGGHGKLTLAEEAKAMLLPLCPLSPHSQSWQKETFLKARGQGGRCGPSYTSALARVRWSSVGAYPGSQVGTVPPGRGLRHAGCLPRL